MADTSDTLGSRVGSSFRRSLASQGKAWAQYGDLLDQFANKKIEAIDFGRRALDVYIGAVGDVFSAGAEVASDTVKTGIDKFSGARTKAEKVIAEVETAVRRKVDTGVPAPTLVAKVRRRAKAAKPAT
jgi:hypothetical protein